MLITIDEIGRVLDRCMAEFVVRNQPRQSGKDRGQLGSGYALLGVSGLGVGNDEVEEYKNSAFACEEECM